VKLGILANTNKPFMVGFPPNATFADEVFYEVHAKREQLWSERIAKQGIQESPNDLWGEPHIGVSHFGFVPQISP